MRKGLVLIPAVLFVLACFPNPARGEGGNTRGDLLKRCGDCRLTLTNLEEIHGELLFLGDDHLEIAVREGPVTLRFQPPVRNREVPFDTILEMRCGEPSWDGSIWGFMVGGVIGSMVMGVRSSIGREPGYEYDTSTAEWTLRGLLIGGGIGALAGYLLDLDRRQAPESKSIPEWLGQ